jgi:NAD(P)-dependent dehydrogenase (short-subunit alcohol dehydrogenase family)
MESSRLDGKVALVTGSGRGIGAGIALELGARGAAVIVNYSRSVGPAELVVEAIKAAGGQAVAIKADVSNPAEIKELFLAAKAAFGGKLDIVCSNAGIEHFDKLVDVTPEDFDRVFAVNTRAQFFVAQQAYIHLEEGGRLVLTSSISAGTGSVREHALYAGSKSAVEAFARCFAGDFGARKIRVNAIAPGGVKSDMALEAGWRYIPGADPSWSMEKIEQHVAKWTPLGRIALPEDIARVVRFLVSKDGGWMSGK